MSTVFSKIINGEIPSYKIAENDQFYAFLDINPLHKGHTLIVPKLEVNYYFDLPDDIIAEMNVFAKKIATAIKKAIPCERIGVAVVGLEVPHAHIHLIPIDKVYDICFERQRLKFTAEEFTVIAKNISEHLHE